MTEEPFYIRQAQIKGGDKTKADWYRQAGEEARAEGATFCRVSYHPDNEDLLLFEGWKTQPKDQGELRWFLTDK